jgi:hypothetical protein
MMARLLAHNKLGVREPELLIEPIAGWSWYCGYHDSYGIGDDEDEVLYMAGAHMHYCEVDGDVCQIYTREWNVRKENPDANTK